MQFLDISGKKFGKLIATSFAMRKNKHSYWNCLCDCGNKTMVTINNLRRNHTKSCGCLKREFERKLSKKGLEVLKEKLTTHGFSYTKFYKTYNGIKKRCNNPKCKSFNNYGGRGIKCFWLSFHNFKNDMYDSYVIASNKFGEENISIDRIDNNGNYSKENCHWVSRKEQARNKRSNHLISFDRQTMCIAEWADKIGIDQDTIGERINNYNWSIERALTTPIRRI